MLREDGKSKSKSRDRLRATWSDIDHKKDTFTARKQQKKIKCTKHNQDEKCANKYVYYSQMSIFYYFFFDFKIFHL